MYGELLAGVRAVPQWLLLGLALGILSSLGLVGVFAIGERLSPTPPRASRGQVGDDRRRGEIRQYLRAIGEPFAEDHPVGDDVVAFYLPAHDVAITFDPRVYYRVRRTRTHPVLVEHELPGAHLGHRLPFETPDEPPGRDSAPTADDPASAFSVLSLPPTATAAEVRAAYREKVKAAHPDNGGSRREFRRVREAYDAARREAS